MRNEMIEMKDLSDSREVMMKKAPPAISMFISVVAIIVVVALVWCYFGQMDTYVTASGEIRTQESVSTIVLTNGGKISNVYLKEGDSVKKGDIILECDSKFYAEQKRIVNGQIDEKNNELANYNRLINSIENDSNMFNKEAEAEFYYRFEDYRLEINSVTAQIKDNNEQLSASIKEIEQSILQTQDDLKNTELLYNEFLNLYNAIANEKEYKSDNILVQNTYKTFLASMNKAEIMYDSSVFTYNNLVELQKQNPHSVTEEQIKQAEYSKNAAFIDLNTVKTNSLTEISSQLLELENQINVYKANIENFRLKKDAMSVDNTIDAAIEKTKNAYLLNISNTMKSITYDIQTLEAQIFELDEALSNCCIKAEQDGVLVYAQDLAIGDTVNSGTTVASIVPESTEYTVYIYVPEYNISSMEIGQKVEYSFSAISATDYGKVYGKILSISEDSFVNQSNGQKFYKATASIDKTELTNKHGKKRNIKTGMLVEVHTITGTQSIMTWLLDKLSFI